MKRIGLLLLAVVMILAACNGETEVNGNTVAEEFEDEPIEQNEDFATGVTEVVMLDTAYNPETLTVDAGTTVTWVNEDDFEHTVTSGTRDSPTDLFDETVAADESFSYTFEEPGTYSYYCSIHPGMDGVIIVQ
jgi:plastocyanin